MTHSKLEKAIPSVIYENQTLNALYNGQRLLLYENTEQRYPMSRFRHQISGMT